MHALVCVQTGQLESAFDERISERRSDVLKVDVFKVARSSRRIYVKACMRSACMHSSARAHAHMSEASRGQR
eukprot:6177334-Pleurochrysis_carterae.AAC.2